MKSRNHRDPVGGPFSRLILRRRSAVGPEQGVGVGISLRRAWQWSRNHVSRATALLIHWMHRPAPALACHVGSRCIKGPIRETNEDRCYADQHRGLFIVADGMGGHVGGECASQAVIETIASRLGGALDHRAVTRHQLIRAITDAVQAANGELIRLARVDVTLTGMGAAVVVGVVWHDSLLLCSVGDSRGYLMRQDELEQLTLDDTLVQGLVSAGALTAGEAARHPMRHVLVHCLCTRQLEKPLLVEQHRLRAGDRLIFASDGLTDSVGHDELAKTSTEHPEARGAAAALVELAQQTGARDNITCIVVDLVA